MVWHFNWTLNNLLNSNRKKTIEVASYAAGVVKAWTCILCLGMKRRPETGIWIVGKRRDCRMGLKAQPLPPDMFFEQAPNSTPYHRMAPHPADCFAQASPLSCFTAGFGQQGTPARDGGQEYADPGVCLLLSHSSAWPLAATVPSSRLQLPRGSPTLCSFSSHEEVPTMVRVALGTGSTLSSHSLYAVG